VQAQLLVDDTLNGARTFQALLELSVMARSLAIAGRRRDSVAALKAEPQTLLRPH
jgi:hypothetical protein